MSLGDFPFGATIEVTFTTRAGGVDTALVGGAAAVYKDNNPAESTAGLVLVANFDGRTGLNHLTVTTSADPTFYTAGSRFAIVLTGGTVGGNAVTGTTVDDFSIQATSTRLVVTPPPGPGPVLGPTSFLDLAAELSGTLPGLSPVLSETYITRAWQDVCRARLWSFLLFDTVVVCPTVIAAGTAALVQGSAQVTMSALARTALLAQTTPPLTDLQFRASSGPLYGIAASDGQTPLHLTLDRAYQGPTNTGASYQVYRAWVGEPVSDFLRWESWDDPSNQRALTGNRLSRSRADFDRQDPGRYSQGLAYYVGHYRGDPLWELWPHPTQGQTFFVQYRSRGIDPDFTSDTSGPPMAIPGSLIMTRALGWYGYPFIEANKGGFPRYARQNLILLIRDAKAQYQLLLADAKRTDDETGLQTVYNRGWQGRDRGGRSQAGPADAAYWQGHPIFW